MRTKRYKKFWICNLFFLWMNRIERTGRLITRDWSLKLQQETIGAKALLKLWKFRKFLLFGINFRNLCNICLKIFNLRKKKRARCTFRIWPCSNLVNNLRIFHVFYIILFELLVKLRFVNWSQFCQLRLLMRTLGYIIISLNIMLYIAVWRWKMLSLSINNWLILLLQMFSGHLMIKWSIFWVSKLQYLSIKFCLR